MIRRNRRILLCTAMLFGLILYSLNSRYRVPPKITIHTDIDITNIVIRNNQLDQKSNFEKNKHFYGGFLVDSWFDVCLANDIHGSLWHPLFPRIPQRRTVLASTSSNGLSGNQSNALNRVYGYLNVENEGEYHIKLKTTGNAEFLLYDTHHSILDINSLIPFKPETYKEIHFLKLSHQRSKFDDNKLSDSIDFIVDLKQSVHFLELLGIGPFELYWKTGGIMENYTLIENEHPFHNGDFLASIHAPTSFFSHKHSYELRFPIENSEREKQKYNFFNVQLFPNYMGLNTSDAELFQVCREHRVPPPKVKLFKGINMIHNLIVYPKEYFVFKDNFPVNRLLLSAEEAMPIVNKIFKTLNNTSKGGLELKEVIHVHTNLNGKFQPFPDWRLTYFYVEFYVESKNTGRIYQTSHFVRKSPHGLCWLADHQWNPNAEIYLLTPVKNQFTWVKLILKVLEDLYTKTKEAKVTLILLDNESNDGDYRELLIKTPAVKSRYIRVPGSRFSKVKALNLGLKNIEDIKDNIAVVMDLHLELPLDFFDRTRKLTIRGKTAFSPTVLRLGECTHEQYTDMTGKDDETRWQDNGPGIMAMYLSDWNAVGKFNEKMFANKWGGEDWELVDRIVSHGLHIIHYRLPRFYHLLHSRKGMWDIKY